MRILLFLYAFSFPVFSFSQEVAIEVIKSKVLYIGVDNYIHVVANNHECKELFIEVDNAYLMRDIGYHKNQCTYIINPKTPGNLEIRIYSSKGKQKQLLRKEKLRALKIQVVKAFVNRNWTDNLISKINLKVSGGIYVPILGFDIDGKYIVKRYKYKFIRNGRIISEGNIKSEKFTEEFYNKLDLLQNFDEIMFYDIEVILPGNITSTIAEPLKIILYDGDVSAFISSEFYPEINQYYWNDSLSENQIQLWENEKIKTKYIDLANKAKKRFDYDDTGNELRECIVKQQIEIDTTIVFDAETYEEMTNINSGYIDILNGPFTEFFPYKAKKIIRLQGQYKDNLKIGIWKACKETTPDKYECYEAEFKDDVMVGEIKKL